MSQRILENSKIAQIRLIILSTYATAIILACKNPFLTFSFNFLKPLPTSAIAKIVSKKSKIDEKVIKYIEYFSKRKEVKS